ncbi:glycosyltransferase family 4 protein [Leptospira sp. 201903075]|uniref:glycosyltransferase family 4 protein n=1 Tax=Leptospira chreensis TaxID=2810035 RepID=UPI0019667A8F|nr:glycosyltransferase family 4 protein [Leptospira chreensis]MBM9590245.1 glycosyltransferase family 4 protein [Leptospira chreensis]
MLKENSLLAKFFRYFERWNYLEADYIGIQSPANITYFKNISPDFADKVVLLYNWSNTENHLPKLSRYREKFNLKDKTIFFYGGNIGKAQDMSILLTLSKKMEVFPEVHFLFVGDGDEVPIVKDYIKNNSSANVSYFPPISQDEFSSLLLEIDVGLFSLHKDHKSHNFPGKILGYLNSGKPVLGAVNFGNDLENLINQSGSGYVCESTRDDLIFENAKRLLDLETRKSIGMNAKKLSKSVFSVETTVDTILGCIK